MYTAAGADVFCARMWWRGGFSFFSQFAKGYWVFSIVLEIQYPSEIERSRAALELLLCKTHRTHQIFSNRYILDKTMEKRKRIWLLPIGHFSAMLKIVL